MATGICYTQSGDVKKYEVDCVKGIRIFDWPSYTCTLSTNSDGTVNTVTSYVPIDNYVCQDLKSFPSYQKNPNVESGTMAFYGTNMSSGRFYKNEYLILGGIMLQQSTFSYNSYACSNHPSSDLSNISTLFPGTDKELFPDAVGTQTIRFLDNNVAPGSTEMRTFGLMTLYGEDYSTGNFKNKNYRYGFVFNLYPEVDLNTNRIVLYSSFKHININVNEHFPYKNVIYRIDMNPNMTIIYYGKYRPAYPENPIVNSSSGFINEISGVSNTSYFMIARDKLFSSRPVNDLNKNYHHFAITGFDNNYGSGISYTYYGQLNWDLWGNKNKLTYSLPSWKKTVNIDSPDWKYIYPPNYSGILIDMYSTSNDTNVTFTFAYFSMLAEYVE